MHFGRLMDGHFPWISDLPLVSSQVCLPSTKAAQHGLIGGRFETYLLKRFLNLDNFRLSAVEFCQTNPLNKASMVLIARYFAE